MILGGGSLALQRLQENDPLMSVLFLWQCDAEELCQIARILRDNIMTHTIHLDLLHGTKCFTPAAVEAWKAMLKINRTMESLKIRHLRNEQQQQLSAAGYVSAVIDEEESYIRTCHPLLVFLNANYYNIKEVSLQDDFFTPWVATHLLTPLVSSLQKLVLTGGPAGPITDDLIEMVANSLLCSNSSSSLKHLKLWGKHVHLQIRGARALANMLQCNNTTLTTLELVLDYELQQENEMVQELATALCQNSAPLQCLHLEYYSNAAACGHSSFQSMARVLPFVSLQQLTLIRRCRFTNNNHATKPGSKASKKSGDSEESSSMAWEWIHGMEYNMTLRHLRLELSDGDTKLKYSSLSDSTDQAAKQSLSRPTTTTTNRCWYQEKLDFYIQLNKNKHPRHCMLQQPLVPALWSFMLQRLSPSAMYYYLRQAPCIFTTLA